jgi:AraC-like DNA-binding protein
VDRLDALLRRFSVSAQLFHSGPLCGVTDFPPRPGLGQLHLVKHGPVLVEYGRRGRRCVDVPSVVFNPRPLAHRFVTDETTGADMACAHVSLGAGGSGPIAQALPPLVVMPLAELGGADALLDVLFREAFGAACGRQAVVDRLFEVVLIHILRQLMNAGAVREGMLAGLAHPQLARSLVALHETPGDDWSLERLAQCAGMSRSHYAATFRAIVDATPGEYLASFRIALAQDALRRGQGLKHIAADVGYGSVAALSRAFKAGCGVSPREWKAREAALE